VGLLEGIAELLAPTRCAGCELPGAVMCGGCIGSLPRVLHEHACPLCGAPFGGLVCTECWQTHYSFERAIALGELSGPLARAVVLHKDAGERRLGGVLGGLLGDVVQECWGRWADAVCWIPPSAAAIARRGFDHGRSLAEPVAAACPDLRCVPMLVRPRARDQRVLGRSARIASAGGSFHASVRVPSRVLVVDDVMTTGATLDAASQALLQAGAEAVRVAVVARAW